MSGAVSASLLGTTDGSVRGLPLLDLLRRYSNTAWNEETAGLLAETYAHASSPRTRRIRLDEELGQPAWADYPSHDAGYARAPLWVESRSALLDVPHRDDQAACGVLFLQNHDYTNPASIKARFVIDLGGLPAVCPAEVLIDTRPATATDAGTVLFADALRARLGLPMVASASVADLLATDDCAVEVDGRFWIRTPPSTPGARQLKHAVGPNYPVTASAEAAEALRAALSRVVVERRRLDVVGGAFPGLQTERLLYSLFLRVLDRGPYLALTALHLAALRLPS